MLAAEHEPDADREARTPGAGAAASARDLPRAHEGRWLAAIIAGAVALRLALITTTAHLPTLFTDEYTFKRHVVFIHQSGLLKSFRDTNTSYVAYQYALWLLSFPYAWLGGAFDTDAMSLRVLVKLPPIGIDAALIATTYAVTRALWPRERSPWAPLAVAAIVAFHPVVVYDSAVWAQIDAVVGLTVLAAIFLAARGRPGAACAMLAFGILNKPQPVLFAPVLIVLIWRTSGPRGIARGAAVAAAVMVAPLLPWLVTGDVSRLAHVYRTLFSNGGKITALTQNAWNLWWFIPFDKVPESSDIFFHAAGIAVTYQRFSLATSMLAALLAAAYVWRFPDGRGGLVAAGYIAAAFYVLPTSTHERYMYPLVVLLAPALLVEPRFRWVYGLLSATLFANMLLVAPPLASWSGRWDDALLTHYIAGVNVVVFAAYSAMLISDLARSLSTARPASSAPAQFTPQAPEAP